MLKFTLSALILCLLPSGLLADVVLSKDGRALARVVPPESEHPVVKQAVSDLEIYLQRVTGGDFSKPSARAEILVLDTIPSDAPKALRDAREGYWIEARGSRIRIVGGSPTGTTYGVYRFLEKYVGVRWFLPTPDGEYIPRRPSLSIPEVSEFSKPAFPMRWVGRGLWGLRNGSNYLDVGEVMGGDGKPATAGYRLEPGIYHTQERYLPVSAYFTEHPEYYALVRGERRNMGKATKLCTSNRAVIAEVARNMGRYLDEHPGLQVISLSPTDGTGFCQCDACVAQDDKSPAKSQEMSRRMVLFYNAVAGALRKTHTDVRLAVGAYHAYALPPKDESVRLGPGISVVLCHYVPACLAHPVNDPDCPANREYNGVIKGWMSRGADGVYFYEYYWKNNWLALPWPIVHTITADIPYFHRIGVKGVYSQYTPDNGYILGLNYYIAAKLLWNPQANVSALVNEFYEKYYAESAKPVREYYEMLEKRMASVDSNIPGDAWTNGTKVYDLEFLEQLRSRLDEAMFLAETDVTRRRIQRLVDHLDYSCRLVGALELKEKGDTRGAYEQMTSLMKDWDAHRQEFLGIVAPVDMLQFLGPRVEKLRKAGPGS